MATIILSKPRQEKFFGPGKTIPIDPYALQLPHSLSTQDGAETVDSPPTSGSILSVTSGNNLVLFNIPRQGHIHELYFQLQLGSPSGTGAAYINYPALHCVQSYEIQCNGSSVVQINDWPTMLSCLISSELTDQQRKIIFGTSGTPSGTPAGVAGSICPLWTPWSSFWNVGKASGFVEPLPVDAISGLVTLRVRFNPLSSLLVGGTGTAGTMDGQLKIERSVTADGSSKHTFMVKSISPKFNTPITLTSGVQNRFQVNAISGEIKQLYLFSRSQTAINSNLMDAYSGNHIPSLSQFFIDSSPVPNDPINNVVALKQMQHKRSYELQSANTGDIFCYDPCQLTGPLKSAIGSLTIKDGSFFELQVTDASNSQIKILALNHAWYIIQDGNLMRRE